VVTFAGARNRGRHPRPSGGMPGVWKLAGRDPLSGEGQAAARTRASSCGTVPENQPPDAGAPGPHANRARASHGAKCQTTSSRDQSWSEFSSRCASRKSARSLKR